MVAALSEQERNVLVAEPDQPVTVVDEQTQQVYYLIPAEQFDRLRSFLSDEVFQPSEAYPLIAKTAAEAGWADPLMDAYDNYEQAHTQR
jgi:hypothetical protein